MTPKECERLACEFPNNECHAIFNIMALDDPALNIYGKNFCQPEHTVFITRRIFLEKVF